MLERWTQYHQSVLVSHLTSADGAIQQFVDQASRYLLMRRTTCSPRWTAFTCWAVVVILGLPLAFTIRRFEIGKAGGAAH